MRMKLHLVWLCPTLIRSEGARCCTKLHPTYLFLFSSSHLYVSGKHQEGSLTTAETNHCGSQYSRVLPPKGEMGILCISTGRRGQYECKLLTDINNRVQPGSNNQDYSYVFPTSTAPYQTIIGKFTREITKISARIGITVQENMMRCDSHVFELHRKLKYHTHVLVFSRNYVGRRVSRDLKEFVFVTWNFQTTTFWIKADSTYFLEKHETNLTAQFFGKSPIGPWTTYRLLKVAHLQRQNWGKYGNYKSVQGIQNLNCNYNLYTEIVCEIRYLISYTWYQRTT